MNSAHELEAGEQFGNYIIQGLLGEGGMGAVYAASDYSLRRDVAIKVLPPGFAGDERLKRRFLKEMELMIKLEHPNLVPVYDVGLEGDQLYIAMRLIPGPNLAQVAAAGAVDPRRAARLLGDVARALSFMHSKRIVHRDVKPQNIFVAEPETRSEYAILGDLGIARAMDSATQLTGGGWIGTPSYIAPELFNGFPASPSSDIYALGCVAYELLTGEIAFGASFEPDERMAMPSLEHISDPLRDVVYRAIAFEAEDRFGDADELSSALSAAVADSASAPARVVVHQRLEDAAAELLRAGGRWMSAEELAQQINIRRSFRRQVTPSEVGARLRSSSVRFQRDGNRFRVWPSSPARRS
jgi:serine/threonine-protein kinase